MSAINQEYISIKHSSRLPSRYHKWTHYGAGAPNTCPPNGPICWQLMPLDKKLPYFKMPSSSQGLCCGQLGKTPWPTRPPHDMCFLDAYGNVTLLPYNAVQDPCLVAHHDKPCVRRRLARSGHLVDNNVVCLLPELNRYREVKRLMNLDEVHYQINMAEKADQEERRLRQIEERLEKCRSKKDVEAIKQDVARHKEKLKKIHEEQIKRMAVKEKRKEKYIKNLEEAKVKERTEKAREDEARASGVQKKHEKQEELERQLVLRMVGKYKKRERFCQTYLKEKSAERRTHAVEEAKRKWEQKKKAMLEEHLKTQAVIADILRERHAGADKRKEAALKFKKFQSSPAFLRQTPKTRKGPAAAPNPKEESASVKAYRYVVSANYHRTPLSCHTQQQLARLSAQWQQLCQT